MDLLKQIEGLKEALDDMRPLDKDQEAAIMQKFRLDWNYHSNHLEGNSLSYGETKALILFNITAQGKPLKDHLEMSGHNDALKWIEEVVKEERPLNQAFIRDLHRLILKNPYEVDAITPDGNPTKKRISIGEYKKTPNHVKTKTGEIFRFATPEETPAKMADLLDWYTSKKGDMHPLLLAAEFHYKFIRIHPFDDGNGRTVRILMNFILMQNGYPPVIIKTEDKQNYFAALQQADAGIIQPFIQYIGENLVHSLDLMLKGAKGENIDQPDDVDKEIALIEQRLKDLNNRNSGKKEIEKSKEVLLMLFDNSLKLLFVEFEKASNKYKNFYKNSVLGFLGDNLQIPFDIKLLRDHFLKGKINQYIYIRCFFESFTKSLMKENLHFDSEIKIVFKDKEYIVKGKKIRLRKNYEMQLNVVEVNTIIRAITKAHTDYINEQIAKAEVKEGDN